MGLKRDWESKEGFRKLEVRSIAITQSRINRKYTEKTKRDSVICGTVVNGLRYMCNQYLRKEYYERMRQKKVKNGPFFMNFMRDIHL